MRRGSGATALVAAAIAALDSFPQGTKATVGELAAFESNKYEEVLLG
jgi:hypothetical protein